MCGGLDLVVWWFSLLGGLGGYYLCIIIPDSSHRVLFEHALHMQPKRGRLDSESWPRAGNPGRDSRKTDRTEISILAPIP